MRISVVLCLVFWENREGTWKSGGVALTTTAQSAGSAPRLSYKIEMS